jgi:uncharacterized membrane protein YidH (DUF202 family)
MENVRRDKMNKYCVIIAMGILVAFGLLLNYYAFRRIRKECDSKKFLNSMMLIPVTALMILGILIMGVVI